MLATEDRRFFSHGGVDAFGVLRAAYRNVMAGEVVEGGSTITQQLAKIAFLSPERTVKRKIEESLLALLLERRYSKEEILSLYLNRVYLGAGAYGVDAASRRYFKKPVGALTLGEAALLAGLLKAPSRYAPTRDPKLARERAETVLAQMVDAGFITTDEAAQAFDKAAPLSADVAASSGARYFADWVLDQVPSFVGPGHGALEVLSTLDPGLQRLAEEVLRTGLAEAGPDAAVGQGAFVVLAPDGAVLALVGGKDYRESPFNRATQAFRQPGSAFKAIVYLAAFEHGLKPTERVLDAPVTVGDWSPDNYDGKYYGEVTVEEAFARSLNSAAVRVAREVGVARILKMARKLGITAELPDDLTLSLGAGSLSPLELTQAYAMIAQGGARTLAHGILEIRSESGEVLYGREGSGLGHAFSLKTARNLARLMAAVVSYGTGRAAALAPELGQAYGKTGTSQDFRDAWFVGFARGLIAGVWLGNDDGKPMSKVTGGSLPARLWGRFMAQALSCPSELFAAGCPWLEWQSPLAAPPEEDGTGSSAPKPGKAEPGRAETPSRSPDQPVEPAAIETLSPVPEAPANKSAQKPGKAIGQGR